MEQQTDWTQTFFTGFILEMFPMMTTPEQTAQEAAFLAQKLTTGRILDVPCGNGRLTLALAARGLNVTGADLTEPLLDEGRRTGAERGLAVTFERRDMRDLPWPAAFEHAICFGNSFGYFDDTGNRAFLSAVQRCLKPGGTFILQTNMAAESVFAQPLKPFWMQLGDSYFLHKTQYDPAAATLTSTYTLIRDGRVELKQAVYRVYTYREIQSMLRDAGFREVAALGSLKDEPYQIGSQGLYLVATNRADL